VCLMRSREDDAPRPEDAGEENDLDPGPRSVVGLELHAACPRLLSHAHALPSLPTDHDHDERETLTILTNPCISAHMPPHRRLLPLCALAFAFAPTLCSAFLPDLFGTTHRARAPALIQTGEPLQRRDKDPNGTTFLWLQDDVYAGKTFFECVPSTLQG
jgi:hypothetical protein